jgi:glutamate N-acetyltransferase / amino-acid N-acetyltransferase
MVDYTVAGVEGGVCAPRGFRAAGVDAGLVPGQGPDLALIVSQQTSAAAGRFTVHPFAAAPVRWSRERLRAGAARAVLVHAGSANAATGADGDADAAALAARCAAAIGCPPGEVLLLGTGTIGVRLAVGDAAEAAEKAAAALGRRGSGEVAKALAASGGTAREHAVAVAWAEGEVRIGGVAKASVPFAPAFGEFRSTGGAASAPPDPPGAGGAPPDPSAGPPGPPRPDRPAPSATTLAVLTTDATVDPGLLDGLLGRALARSFERVMVDQAPGMADGAILLANATAAAPTLRAGSDGAAAFEAALAQLCESLAEGLALRVPGTGKLVVVTVHGAAEHTGALAAARAVAGSVALRAALAGGVAAWPAVLDALATARVELDPQRVGVRFGPVTVVAGGQAAPHDERAAAAVVAKSQVDLAVDLGVGPAAATVTTTDLPAEALGRHTR